jgi:hypothetical protein
MDTQHSESPEVLPQVEAYYPIEDSALGLIVAVLLWPVGVLLRWLEADEEIEECVH